jgi:CubicO group peptidase (beta-lactamase class C family)
MAAQITNPSTQMKSIVNRPTTIRCAVFAIMVATFSQSCAQPRTEAVLQLSAQPGWSKELVGLVGKRLAAFPNHTHVALALIEGNSVYYYGVVRTADTLKFRNNPEQVFEIGSITKVFTSTLLAQLVTENKLRLTDTLGGFFSFPLKAGSAITLQQLANHTSGLPRLPSNLMPDLFLSPGNPYKNYSAEKLETYLKNDVALNSKPGEKMEYSNLGAGLLAYVLAQHQKSSLETLFQQRIFKPLGMNHSSLLRENVRTHLVEGIDGSGNTVSYWDLMALEGAGAILSSAHDLARFAQAQFNPQQKAVALTQQATHNMNDRAAVALGWMIRTDGQQKTIWHNGGTGGFSSCMAVDLTNQRAVIVLSNYSRLANKSQNIDELCFELLRD